MITDFLKTTPPKNICDVRLHDLAMLYYQLNMNAIRMLQKEMALSEKPDDRRAIVEYNLAKSQFELTNYDFHAFLEILQK